MDIMHEDMLVKRIIMFLSVIDNSLHSDDHNFFIFYSSPLYPV